ncbi:hypothetical protein Acy02nite_89300 [Actinoplanes cyaneus]|uniref:Uncharacterized protein n=1 Tax=Actinoplanes cyaneus TaxID=52696 RepID=A0A919ISQ8_9ACTN|nr:hypothetical protein [Actinoplanes cyaneus]GID71049.1 hypothetical protein Acy02nite_89300 [Actinoplanes cyaneus]
MDVADLLTRAVEMVPATAVNEAGGTVTDAREYLDHNEWEIALDVLADLYDRWRPPAQWWDLLIEAADLMWLTETATWCRWGRWGRWESLHGIVRAELQLFSPSHGGRAAAIPSPGVLRPLWDIGQRNAAGQPDLRVARMWVEYSPELAPGTTGSVRLAPLVPLDWRGLQPGQSITMHEGTPAVGVGTIIEVFAPVLIVTTERNAARARSAADQYIAIWSRLNAIIPRQLRRCTQEAPNR